MGRALDSAEEAVSPELALIDPELRRELAAEAWQAALALAAKRGLAPPSPSRRRLRLYTAAALAAMLLLPAAVALADPPPPPAHVRVVPPPRPLPPPPVVVPAATRPPDAHARPLPHAPRPHRAPRRDVREIEPAAGLLGPLPDPTPPRARLSPTGARALLQIAQKKRMDWAALLAAAKVPTPYGFRTAKRDLTPAQQAAAAYHRAVGLDALVSGLWGARRVLAARVLRDPRIQINAAGRGDIAIGKVDVRVLVLLLYLAKTEGSVAVSSLVSGHGGTVSGPSTHAYGAAVDLRAIGGVPVRGNAARVERAIRAMLLLPEPVRPRQVFSQLDLGGPSIALEDHDRTIHVGFDPTLGDRLELLWRTAGATYGIAWSLLGAINDIETDNGNFLAVSPAGAVGWMQFMPSTWSMYGVDADGNGAADPWNPTDAIFAAARYLAAAGGRYDEYRATWAYNHADWYVRDVLGRKARLEAS